MTGGTALVVLSGGQDSTTCLYWAKTRHDDIHAITFDYGQRHSREIECALDIGACAVVSSHEIIEVPDVLHSSSPLVDMDADLEQYKNYEEMDKIIGDRVELTFVPMRNQLFLTIAANRAVCVGAKNIITGVCQSDNANYPDCRRTFIDSAEMAINKALGNDQTPDWLFIDTPLMDMSKAESIKFAMELDNGAYEALAWTHTAYDGSYPPTGSDHATVLRAQGFLEAGVPDPLIVRAWKEGLMELPGTLNYDQFR